MRKIYAKHCHFAKLWYFSCEFVQEKVDDKILEFAVFNDCSGSGNFGLQFVAGGYRQAAVIKNKGLTYLSALFCLGMNYLFRPG
jgi:hypothetical protein